MKKCILVIMLIFVLSILGYILITRKTDPDSVKGIFYFDVDGTITTANNFESIIQECLKNNIAVGIITNSHRTVASICTGNLAGGNEIGSSTWMSDTLCKQFNKNERMFNSRVVVAGKTVAPPGYPEKESPGYIKAFDMNYGRDLFYPNIPDRCVVLFDDDLGYLEGVVEYNKINNTTFGMVCANKTCGGKYLNIDMVKKTIQDLICATT
jgi:hypothetical protein